jgi:hypothetical protein
MDHEIAIVIAESPAASASQHSAIELLVLDPSRHLLQREVAREETLAAAVEIRGEVR